MPRRRGGAGGAVPRRGGAVPQRGGGAGGAVPRRGDAVPRRGCAGGAVPRRGGGAGGAEGRCSECRAATRLVRTIKCMVKP